MHYDWHPIGWFVNVIGNIESSALRGVCWEIITHNPLAFNHLADL